jgi:hypothetical protein
MGDEEQIEKESTIDEEIDEINKEKDQEVVDKLEGFDDLQQGWEAVHG